MTRHPGRFILKRLDDMGISQRRLARHTGYSVAALNKVVLGYHSITPRLAVLLGAALGVHANDWLMWQNAWDLKEARKEAGKLPRRLRA